MGQLFVACIVSLILGVFFGALPLLLGISKKKKELGMGGFIGRIIAALSIGAAPYIAIPYGARLIFAVLLLSVVFALLIIKKSNNPGDFNNIGNMNNSYYNNPNNPNGNQYYNNQYGNQNGYNNQNQYGYNNQNNQGGHNGQNPNIYNNQNNQF